MKRALILPLAIACTVGAPAQTQTPPEREPVDVTRLGPQVGERVPAFSLKDQTGAIRTLESILGPQGAMIVFYRSADW